MGAAGLKVRKEEGMRVRGTIQFSRRGAERVRFMAATQAARSRGLRESLCVLNGRMSALPPEATATPLSEVTIDSYIAPVLARVNRWETNSRVNPANGRKDCPSGRRSDAPWVAGGRLKPASVPARCVLRR